MIFFSLKALKLFKKYVVENLISFFFQNTMCKNLVYNNNNTHDGPSRSIQKRTFVSTSTIKIDAAINKYFAPIPKEHWVRDFLQVKNQIKKVYGC